jgi:hypothetical protein
VEPAFLCDFRPSSSHALGMVASPRDLDPLDVEHEKGLMDEAIEDLQANGLVELSWLEGDTWRDLLRAMRREGPWHIFHFVGHGDFDLTAQEGSLPSRRKKQADSTC